MRASMSRSLRMNRAATVFFLPDARVIGRGAGVVLAGLRGGVAARVVAELAEHPGAEDGCQAGLGQVDLSVRVPAKIAPTSPSSILTCSFRVVITAIRDAGGGGVGRGEPAGAGQLPAAQRGQDRLGPVRGCRGGGRA